MTAEVADVRRSVAQLKALVAQAQADSVDWTADDVAAWTAEHFGGGRVAVACSMAGDTVVPHLIAEHLPGVHVLFLQTGYVPIRKSVSNEPALKDYMAKSPNAEMLVKQLQYASAIPLFSELGNSDEQLRKAIEKIELGVGTAQEALNTAADVINKALAVP